MDKEYLDVKVTAYAEGWGIRIMDKRYDRPCHPGGECLVKNKHEVSPAIAEILRWHDKCGGLSRMASSSRDRQKYRPPTHVRHRHNLPPVYSWDGETTW